MVNRASFGLAVYGGGVREVIGRKGAIRKSEVIECIVKEWKLGEGATKTRASEFECASASASARVCEMRDIIYLSNQFFFYKNYS